MGRGWTAAVVVWCALLAGPAGAGTISVPAGGNLQAALDGAAHGDTILLAPGATYIGNFIIRRGVTVRTDGPLPEGRMTPAWSGRLAIVRSPNNEPALATGPSVTGVRLIGLEVAPNGHVSGTSIGIGSLTEVNNARQPIDVVLDRLLVRGHPVNGQKRGLSLHGSHITVTRSYISDMKQQGQDTQAIWINNGWGPYTIVDNYLEASGENIMAGGDTPRIDQLIPSDILIERNTIAKPLSWKQESWTVKNLIEMKSAKRVTIRGNWLEGSWLSGQVGYGILLTPKDQYGLAPWTTVQDVRIEFNVVRDIGEGMRILGDDNVHPAVRGRNFTIRHNLFVVDAVAHGGSGRCLVVGRAPQYVEFSANTCIENGSVAFYTYWGGDVREIHGGVFRGNVFLHNEYGFSAEEFTSGGIGALNLHYVNGVLERNLIGGGSASRYPSDHVLGIAEFQAQFVNYAGGNYRLTDAARARFTGADGRYPGADFEALAAALAGGPAPPPEPPVVPNAPPVAVSQTVSAVGGTPLGVVLSGSDPDGDVLAFAVASAPAHGTVTGVAPLVTYTGAAGYAGTDSFTFTVSDGRGGSATGTVTVHVSVPNRAPSAVNQTLAATSGQPLAIVLSGSDPDGDVLAFAVAAGPAQGVLAGVAPNLTYTSSAGFAGVDSFTFTVSDGRGGTATGTVAIQVSAPVTSAMVSTSDLPDGRVGSGYSAQLEVAGGAAPYAWARVSGTLPPGLTLDAAGRIAGTPSEQGTFDFVVRVTDAAGRRADRSLSISIAAAPGKSGSAPGKKK